MANSSSKMNDMGKGNNLREGVLFINGTPFYIVDFFYVNEAVPMVAVFGIKKSSIKDFENDKDGDINILVKDYELQNVFEPKYRFTTPLSTKLKEDKELEQYKDKGYKKRYQAPLYMSVVGDGTSTLSNEYAPMGFYDKSTNGESTGIFISLDDLTWFDDNRELVIMLNTLTSEAEDYVSSFFDDSGTDMITMPPVEEEQKDDLSDIGKLE